MACFHFHEAQAQGLEPQDFAKEVLTVAHFVEHGASNYPSNKLHQASAKGDKLIKEQQSFRPVQLAKSLQSLDEMKDHYK